MDEPGKDFYSHVESNFKTWSKGDLAAINFLCGDGTISRQLALENVVRHVRLRVLQQAVGARDAVEQSLLHALRDLFAAVPLHVALYFLEYAAPQIAVLGEEECKFAKSRGVAKDPDGRRFQVTILRKGPHEMHCVELAFFHGFRDSGDFLNVVVTPLYGSMQSETVGFGHHAVLLLERSQDGARKPMGGRHHANSGGMDRVAATQVARRKMLERAMGLRRNSCWMHPWPLTVHLSRSPRKELMPGRRSPQQRNKQAWKVCIRARNRAPRREGLDARLSGLGPADARFPSGPSVSLPAHFVHALQSRAGS